MVKQRKKDIQSIAVSGDDLRAQATHQPVSIPPLPLSLPIHVRTIANTHCSRSQPSRFQHRVTTRSICPPPRSHVPPTLAYFNALVQPKTKPTTRAKPDSLRSQRKLRRPQNKRHPGPPPEKVKLKVVAIGPKPSVQQVAGGEERAKGRKRLSAERRVLERKKRAREMMQEALRAVEMAA